MKTIRKIGKFLLATVVIGVIFALSYALMSASRTQESHSAQADVTPCPYEKPLALEGVQTQSVARYFPYPVAAVTGEGYTANAQSAYDVRVQGTTCRVVERAYTDGEGCTVTARSATPAAYLAAYADCAVTQEVYAMPDGRSAQYLEGAQRICLLLRNGEVLYALESRDGRDALLRAAAALGFE